jgi:hypothetical protein
MAAATNLYSPSPDADDELTGVYNASHEVVSPITFKDNSISLRDVLALFTPPPGMRGSSAILGTIQLIVSQLRPPFDLQSTWVPAQWRCT